MRRKTMCPYARWQKRGWSINGARTMKSRREFVQELSGGLMATLAASSTTRASSLQQSAKPIRIGIIGAENSHTVEYGQIFNRDRKFPGCEVIGVWGETPEF